MSSHIEAVQTQKHIARRIGWDPTLAAFFSYCNVLNPYYILLCPAFDYKQIQLPSHHNDPDFAEDQDEFARGGAHL
jgi:hypothetical protein